MKKTILVRAALAILVLLSFQFPAMAVLVTDGIEDFSAGMSDWIVTDATGSTVTDGGGNNYALLEEDMYFMGSLSQNITLDSSHNEFDFDYDLGLTDSSLDPNGFYDSFQVVLYNGSESLVLFQDDFDEFDADVLTDPAFTHVEIDLAALSLDSFWGSESTLSFDLIDVDGQVNSAFALDNVYIGVVNGTAPVPEPATLLLLGMGLGGLGLYRRIKPVKALL